MFGAGPFGGMKANPENVGLTAVRWSQPACRSSPMDWVWGRAARWSLRGCPGPGLCVVRGPAHFSWARLDLSCWACMGTSSAQTVPTPLQHDETLTKCSNKNHLFQSLSLLSAQCDPVTGRAPLGGLPRHIFIVARGQRSSLLCGLTFKKTHFIALSFRMCCYGTRSLRSSWAILK